MVKSARDNFLRQFTCERYRHYLNLLQKDFPGSIEFRVAETPVFVGNAFRKEMLDTCEYIVDQILQPDFKVKTQGALPDFHFSNEDGHPDFLVFDFGICQDLNGRLNPQLIEMQGFPSLFMYQLYQDEAAREAYQIPEEWQIFLNGYDRQKVIGLMSDIILDGNAPENVILLELYPEKQKTRIDFYYTQRCLGIRPVCLTHIFRKGRQLYYRDEDRDILIRRIYNRLIPDDVLAHKDPFIQHQFQLLQGDVDVTWVTHPNWFYRVSKYTLPLLRHAHIPRAQYLSDLNELPSDLENYVLKPLFSFAGKGVIIDLRPEDLPVTDQKNYLLQSKVEYASAIRTPTTLAKAEIRIFYLWPKGADRPVATHNLARLTKGKMIGVGFNQDVDWVGGSFAYFNISSV